MGIEDRFYYRGKRENATDRHRRAVEDARERQRHSEAVDRLLGSVPLEPELQDTAEPRPAMGYPSKLARMLQWLRSHEPD